MMTRFHHVAAIGASAAGLLLCCPTCTAGLRPAKAWTLGPNESISAFASERVLLSSTATMERFAPPFYRMPSDPSETAVRSRPAHHLHMSSDNKQAKRSKSQSRGVYARPSAAIERGSGFFVPGLEGSRVRLLFGVVVLALTYVNRVAADGSRIVSDAQILSEAVAIVYGLLLLLQAAVEFGKELGFGLEDSRSAINGREAVAAATTETPSMSPPSASMRQTVSTALASSDRALNAVRWAAATYVAMTPATHVLLIGTDNVGESPEVYYSLGEFGDVLESPAEAKDGVKAAVGTAFGSKGGRVSIPSDHPASKALLPEGGRRCVVLQRVGSDGSVGDGNRICFLIGSDKLLPSFTKNDLRWLGRLALYVRNKMS